jgi:hypothetical protein
MRSFGELKCYYRHARTSIDLRAPAIAFLGRMPLLGVQPGFLCRSRRLRGPSSSGDDERSPHEIGETFLRQLPISTLASHVACDDANASLRREPGRELLLQSGALCLVQRARAENVPEDLHARRCLVHVLSAGTRGPRDAHVELGARDRERLVDREEIPGSGRRRVAHSTTASGTT